MVMEYLVGRHNDLHLEVVLELVGIAFGVLDPAK